MIRYSTRKFERSEEKDREDKFYLLYSRNKILNLKEEKDLFSRVIIELFDQRGWGKETIHLGEIGKIIQRPPLKIIIFSRRSDIGRVGGWKGGKRKREKGLGCPRWV